MLVVVVVVVVIVVARSAGVLMAQDTATVTAAVVVVVVVVVVVPHLHPQNWFPVQARIKNTAGCQRAARFSTQQNMPTSVYSRNKMQVVDTNVADQHDN